MSHKSDIEIAREAGLPYVYLGYWVPGSPKMAYKSKFSGLEIYAGNRWQPMRNAEDFGEEETRPAKTTPIAEQVANIQLPQPK